MCKFKLEICAKLEGYMEGPLFLFQDIQAKFLAFVPPSSSVILILYKDKWYHTTQIKHLEICGKSYLKTKIIF